MAELGDESIAHPRSPYTGRDCLRFTVPWRHHIVDQFLPHETTARFYQAAKATANFDMQPGDPYQVQYAPVDDVSLAGCFLSIDFVRFLEAVTGSWCRPSDGLIQFRKSDETTPPFPVHVDRTPKKSFVSIFYLTPNWNAANGGRLRLHDSPESNPVVELEPLSNRLVLFETAGSHWHSVEKVHAGERYSIMVEWIPID